MATNLVAYQTTQKGLSATNNVTATPASGDKWALDVNIASGSFSVTASQYKGTLDLRSASDVTIPGSEVTLISFTNGPTESRDIWQVNASTMQTGKLSLLINSVVVLTGRIGPGKYDIAITLTPYWTTGPGDLVQVKFKAISGVAASDIEAYLQCDQY